MEGNFSVFAVLFVTLLTLLPVMIVAYFCGCFNGAITISKLFYHDDVRRHGSGNAGLTNFYRTYGAKHAPLVILCDMGKAAVAVGLAVLYLRLKGASTADGLEVYAKYIAGLFCIVGHMFPVTYHFRGGKGILCSGTLLLCLDWRIALVSWGLFLIFLCTTRYVSLGSISAAVAFPFATHLVYGIPYLTALSVLMAGLVLWAHRKNMARLLRGTENKFHFRVSAPNEKKG